ncbi:hypothetical protein HZS_2855 [Henneguya salminicola]|nr:hypothetical protein HZS_2855 [Henneguya salminicola]
MISKAAKTIQFLLLVLIFLAFNQISTFWWSGLVLKLLPILWLIFVHLSQMTLTNILDLNYGKWILFGLIFSLFGDIFMYMSDFSRFLLAGIFFFTCAHVCYFRAFKTLHDIPNTWQKYIPVYILLPMICWMSTYLPDAILKMIQILYSVAILLTAIESAQSVHMTLWGFWPAIGMITFVCSDVLLFYYLFISKYTGCHAIPISLYYLAQFILTMSSQSMTKISID